MHTTRWRLRLPCVLLFLLVAVSNVLAMEDYLDERENYREQCRGMYAKNAMGGNIDPYINIIFSPVKGDEPQIVSLIIFAWSDVLDVGVPEPDGSVKVYICDTESVERGLCTQEHFGEFLVTNSTRPGSIFTKAINLAEPKPYKYYIKDTDYYCVATFGMGDQVTYNALVEWRNSFGELNAAEYPKLPFYGGLAIVYTLIGALWGFLYFQHRSDVLPIQNYITAIIAFMLVEMVFIWFYYDYINRHGNNAGSRVLMVIVAIMNAARGALSFFMLLIVCMGYSIVKPSLGPAMWRCRILGIAHFIFAIVFAVGSMLVTPESASPWILLVIVPLTATTTTFYVWIISSLNGTIRDLADRKQTVKMTMYKRVWGLLLWSVLVLFSFFFLNVAAFAQSTADDFAPENWKSRWFFLDGWLNILYLVVFATIVYIIRPSANNKRFAMSDELRQEDDDFDLSSLHDLELGETDEDAELYNPPDRSETPNNKSSPPRPAARKEERDTNGETSKPILTRQSEDGAVFSIGDDEFGKWADDDDEEDDDDESVEMSAPLKGKFD